MTNVVESLSAARFAQLIRRIKAGHARAERGDNEWIEGSIEVAIALREGREALDANADFGAWLATNGLGFYGKNDRAALLNMAVDIEAMRRVLASSASRSYQLIWKDSHHCFPSNRKTPAKPRRERNKTGRADLHRAMKLGDETIARLRGTSLDTSAELDELVMLNRGAAPGELTEIVKRLVDEAAAGQDVSAIALGSTMNRQTATGTSLLACWKKRMVTAWQLAGQQGRLELVLHQLANLDAEHRRRLALYLNAQQGEPNESRSHP